jgi:hypothetical protein
MATIKIAVFRLRALDKELAEILEEADSRCATSFALQLDDMRERLATGALNAIAKNEARTFRRFADRDDKGHLKPSEKSGGFMFTNAESQEKLTDALEELNTSLHELDDSILAPKIKISDLVRNGLAVSGSRRVNLRPVLDMESLDEQIMHPTPERTVFLTAPPPRGTPHA